MSYGEAVNNSNNFLTNASNVNSNIFTGETPSSIACIYQQVAQPTAQPSGCNPHTTTVHPSGGGGAIAIIDPYDTPSAPKDMVKFSTYFGLPAANFQVIYAGGSPPYITGSKPPSSVGSGWDVETALDIEWSYAMAPKAKIFLVEAQNSSLDALTTALQAAQYLVSHNGGGEISMSYTFDGGEYSWETSYDSFYNTARNLPNVVYLASSGDRGGAVVYPSASPYVFSVGGTTINRDINNNFVNETSWVDGGGGKSVYELRPSFQNSVQTVVGLQRGTPDFAMDANPTSGVGVTLAGQWYTVGGTSVSTPMSAGIFNVANAAKPYDVASTIHNTLYNKGLIPTYFRDITSGTCGSFNCAEGYDLCTGWGSLLGYGASNSSLDIAFKSKEFRLSSSEFLWGGPDAGSVMVFSNDIVIE